MCVCGAVLADSCDGVRGIVTSVINEANETVWWRGGDAVVTEVVVITR